MESEIKKITSLADDLVNACIKKGCPEDTPIYLKERDIFVDDDWEIFLKTYGKDYYLNISGITITRYKIEFPRWLTTKDVTGIYNKVNTWITLNSDKIDAVVKNSANTRIAELEKAIGNLKTRQHETCIQEN